MSGERVRRPLSGMEIAEIEAVTKAAGSEAGFQQMWAFLVGTPWDEMVGDKSITRVSEYAIPYAQDKELQRILSVPPSRASKKRWSRRTTAMQFLFYGPANYDYPEGTD